MPVTKSGRHYNAPEAASRATLASAARTTNATSTPFNVEDAKTIIGKLTISAAAGTTPTLDASLEVSADGTNYYTVGSFAQKTAAGNETRAFPVAGAVKARWRWVIGGTGSPSFTFKLDVTSATP